MSKFGVSHLNALCVSLKPDKWVECISFFKNICKVFKYFPLCIVYIHVCSLAVFFLFAGALLCFFVRHRQQLLSVIVWNWQKHELRCSMVPLVVKTLSFSWSTNWLINTLGFFCQMFHELILYICTCNQLQPAASCSTEVMIPSQVLVKLRLMCQVSLSISSLIRPPASALWNEKHYQVVAVFTRTRSGEAEVLLMCRLVELLSLMLHMLAPSQGAKPLTSPCPPVFLLHAKQAVGPEERTHTLLCCDI